MAGDGKCWAGRPAQQLHAIGTEVSTCRRVMRSAVLHCMQSPAQLGATGRMWVAPTSPAACPTCGALRHGREQLRVSPGQQRADAGVHRLDVHLICRQGGREALGAGRQGGREAGRHAGQHRRVNGGGWANRSPRWHGKGGHGGCFGSPWRTPGPGTARLVALDPPTSPCSRPSRPHLCAPGSAAASLRPRGTAPLPG